MRQVINFFKPSVFPVLIVTLLTFTIFGCVSPTMEKNLNKYSTVKIDKDKNLSYQRVSKHESGLRFDGIYQAAKRSGYIFLRFYHKGKVCRRDGRFNFLPKSAAQSHLKENYRDVINPTGCGDYLIMGSKITFSAGGVNFWGDIQNDTLVLKIEDHQRIYKATKKFWFIKEPEYAQRSEVLKQKEEIKKAQVKKLKVAHLTENRIKSQKITKNVILYDGIYQAVGKPINRKMNWVYLRFYANGKVLKAKSSYISRSPKFVGKVSLKKDYNRVAVDGRWIIEGEYNVENSEIEIRFNSMDQVWKGKIQRDTITFSLPAVSDKKELPDRFWFLAEPEYAQRPESLEQMKKRIKELALAETKKAKVEKQKKVSKKEGPHVRAVVEYDQYSRPKHVVLKNINGNGVVKKVMEFSKYNSSIISKQTIIDSSSGKTIYTINYDAYGKPKNNRWMCLDKNGNMVMKKGKPVFVKTFNAKQKMMNRYTYNGAYRTGQRIIMYPCENCAEKTGIKNCVYVW